MNLVFLAGFTGLEAYSISVITSFYESRIVIEALIFTLGIFVALSLFACQTKYDFTSWMPYLFGALWVLILFGFMAAFFPSSSGVELGYGIVAALIFSGYILVDTQVSTETVHWQRNLLTRITVDHPPLPSRGGDCRSHLALPRHPQSLPGYLEDPEQPAEQLSTMLPKLYDWSFTGRKAPFGEGVGVELHLSGLCSIMLDQ